MFWPMVSTLTATHTVDTIAHDTMNARDNIDPGSYRVDTFGEAVFYESVSAAGIHGWYAKSSRTRGGRVDGWLHGSCCAF